MAKQETNTTNNIMLEMSPRKTTLWKNVRGLFWTLDKKRKVSAGLLVPGGGGSDLIGGTEVLITPEMVGKTVFIFTVIEVKTETGDVQDNQREYIDFVKSKGGFAGVARNNEEAIEIVRLDDLLSPAHQGLHL